MCMDLVKLFEICEKDCREGKEIGYLNDLLSQTRPFFEKEVTFRRMENLCAKVCRKYQINITGIYPTFIMGSSNYWRSELYYNKTSRKIIYGGSLEEIMLKSTLVLYYMVENKMLKKR